MAVRRRRRRARFEPRDAPAPPVVGRVLMQGIRCATCGNVASARLVFSHFDKATGKPVGRILPPDDCACGATRRFVYDTEL